MGVCVTVDSLLSSGHMAGCQRFRGGNLIQQRKRLTHQY